MMRKLLLVLGASASFAGSALAADVMADGPRNWSGPYLGIVGGAGLFNSEATDLACSTSCDSPDLGSWGASLGATAGWNGQSGYFVYGLEGDLSWSNLENHDDFNDGESVHDASWSYLATLRARAGLTLGNVFGYVTGGAALAQTDYRSETNAGYSYDADQTQLGLAAGVGAEIALSDRLTLKGESLYLGFPSVDAAVAYGSKTDPLYAALFRSEAQLLRAGLNYNFGSAAGEVEPVSAAEDVDWSGFYLGIVGTGGLLANDMSEQWGRFTYGSPDMSSWGGGLGVTAGWNAQSGRLVYGVEGDLSWVGFETEYDNGFAQNNTPIGVKQKASLDYLATLRARAGLAAGNVLAYVTGGVAIAQTDYSSLATGKSFDPDLTKGEGYSAVQTQVGLAAGMGVEVALSERMSFKGEYLYVGFPDVTTGWNSSLWGSDNVMTYTSEAHLLRAGLNYSFGRTSGSEQPFEDADWSGIYAGALGTGGMLNNEMSETWGYISYGAPDMAGWGAGLGATVGWNGQSGHLVYGAEADLSWLGLDNQLDIGGGYDITHKASWDYLGTFRARAGLAAGNVLGYVTGGVALGHTDYSSWDNEAEEGFSTKQTQLGLAAGAGVEMALGQNLSLKGEYLYVGFPDVDASYQESDGQNTTTGGNYRSEAYLLRVGMNYGF